MGRPVPEERIGKHQFRMSGGNALDNRRRQGYIDGATSPAETGYSTSRKPLSGFGFAPPCEAYAELVDVATAKSYLRGGFFSATFPYHRNPQYPDGPDAGSGPCLHPGDSDGCAAQLS